MISPNRTDLWILDGHLAVPCHDMLAWAQWMQTANRHVAKTQIGELSVSTVFLGLDHNFPGTFSKQPEDYLPLIFETMIFGGMEDNYQTRCATWEEAEAMHRVAVDIATGWVESVSSIKEWWTSKNNAGPG